MQGAGLEPASRGSGGPCEELEVTNMLSGHRGRGHGQGGAGIMGIGGVPDPRCCGVPPVQADRRALWLPVELP